MSDLHNSHNSTGVKILEEKKEFSQTQPKLTQHLLDNRFLTSQKILANDTLSVWALKLVPTFSQPAYHPFEGDLGSLTCASSPGRTPALTKAGASSHSPGLQLSSAQPAQPMLHAVTGPLLLVRCHLSSLSGATWEGILSDSLRVRSPWGVLYPPPFHQNIAKPQLGGTVI